MSELKKAVDLVREARWESWRRLAEKLPDHHVLAVEMYRVDRHTTVSIFTLVRHGKVVQEVLQGDGRGLNVRPVAPHADRCVPLPMGRSFQVESLMMSSPTASTGDGDPVAYSIAYGEPPPKQGTEPGIVASGGVTMANTFDTTELLVGGS
ncbi:MAG TPA: hypothetical protein VF516_02065 [Kofleriaceae bacterium]